MVVPVEVGVGYVSVVPETRGFGPELLRQISGPSGDAGTRAGGAAGDGFLGGMKGKLAGGIGAVAGLAGAALAKGVVEAAQREKAADKLGASLGLSDKQAARLGKVAGKLYAKGYGESIDQITDSLKALAQNGVASVKAPKKELDQLSRAALSLSETFDADVGESAKAAGQLIRTGLVKNGREAFDLLTVGFQSGADKAGDLLDTVNEYSTQWRKSGLSGAQGIGLINQALRAGARDGDVAADAIKEFSIRAVDGSKTSADGFKALGLNADDMASKFAKGGKSANGVLDLTLDKLRGVKDPVEQSQIAVALFGTQAEDLGASLLAMDPSKAADGLGKVGGAADRMGKQLHDNAATQVEVFKRRLLGLATDAGAKVLPKLVAFGGFLDRRVVPPMRTAGEVAARTLVPAVKGTADAFQGGVRWVKDYGAWLIPLGVAVGGLTLLLSAQSIAAAAATGAFSLYMAVSRGAAAVTRGFAVAQGILNAVMTANPIGLLVVGLVTLGVLLVVAYKKSETFRGIVQGAWDGIRTAATWAWEKALKPALDGIVTGATAVADAATWLWGTVLKPVFDGIGLGARILATIIGVVLIGPWIVAFKVLAPVVTWLWQKIVKPAFDGIAEGATWMNEHAIQPAMSLARTAFRALGNAGAWLLDKATTVFHGIADVVLWAYDIGIKPQIDLAKTAFRLFGTAVGSAKDRISTAVHGIADVAKWLYDHGLKPQIDAGKRLVNTFADAFKTAKDNIDEQWQKLKGIAKKPISFIVDTVYNRGIVGVWNKVASAFGAPKLEKFQFASGGVMPGYTPGRDPHKFYSPTGGRLELSGGEAVMRPEFTRAVGPGFVNSVNRIARSRGTEGVRRALAPALGGNPRQKFALGGIVGDSFDWIGKKVAGAGSAAWDAVKESTEWLKDGLEASARAGVKAVVNPLLKNFPGMDTGFGKMLREIPNNIIDALFGYSKKADKKGASGIGGVGVQAALKWARTQAGKPYQWGGNGNPSWDCSGLMSAIESVIRGQKPHRRWTTFAFNGPTAPPGWRLGLKSPFQIGVTNAGVGHTAGTLGGTHVESRGGDGVLVGPRARGANNRLFQAMYGFAPAAGYAGGGRPRPGELAWVGEQGPELVRFRGGETVYSNRDSLRMAEGLVARGFAKGTSAAAKARASARASARKDLPGDLSAFTRSLTRSAADIGSAAKALTEDLKKAGAGARAVASVQRTSARLQDLAVRRDKVAARITEARGFAADQRRSAADFLGLANVNPAGVGGIISGLKTRQSELAQWQTQVKTLEKKGLSRNLLSQVIAQGPGGELAGILASATAGQVKQLNALSKSGTGLAVQVGNTMADLLYDAGSQAGKGFLAGLVAQEDALQHEMNKLGRGMVASIKKELRIKSPSRVTAEVGEQVGAGLVGGMARSARRVSAAGARLAQAAVPQVPLSQTIKAAARSEGPQVSYTIHSRTADITVRDLELLQRRQEALARVGRPR